MKKAKLFILIFVSTFAFGKDITLTVNVTGAEPNVGQAILGLFTNEGNFLKKPVRRIIKPIGEKKELTFILKNLKPGTYAISIIYDKDKNGELKTGLFGIPTEPVGMSNNAKGSFGPPSFEDAKFSLTEDKTMKIIIDDIKKKRKRY